MAQITKRNEYIQNVTEGSAQYGSYSNNIDQDSFINKDLLLVPARGNYSVYTISDNTQTIDIDFILNTDLYDWIVLLVDNQSMDDEFIQSFEISQLTIQDGIVTVPFNPASPYSSDRSFQVIAYLANKNQEGYSPTYLDYRQMKPSTFYICNLESPPAVFWSNTDPYPPVYNSTHFLIFYQEPWLEPLYIESQQQKYYCISQGDVTRGID